MKYILLNFLGALILTLLISCDFGRHVWLESEKHYTSINRIVEFHELIGNYEVLDTLTRKEFKLKEDQRLRLEIHADSSVTLQNVLIGDTARVFTDTLITKKFTYSTSIYESNGKKYFINDFRSIVMDSISPFRSTGIGLKRNDSTIVINFLYALWNSGDPGLTRTLRYWKVE